MYYKYKHKSKTYNYIIKYLLIELGFSYLFIHKYILYIIYIFINIAPLGYNNISICVIIIVEFIFSKVK